MEKRGAITASTDYYCKEMSIKPIPGKKKKLQKGGKQNNFIGEGYLRQLTSISVMMMGPTTAWVKKMMVKWERSGNVVFSLSLSLSLSISLSFSLTLSRSRVFAACICCFNRLILQRQKCASI